METQSTENLSGPDRGTRTLVGASLVGLTLILPLTSAEITLLCLAAAYPLITALIAWDPVVAAANIITKMMNSSDTHTPRVR